MVSPTRVLAVVVGLVCLLCAGIAVAQQNVVRIPSKVTVHRTHPVVKGRVKSHRCRQDRKVKLRSVEADKSVGKDKTNKRGHYKITGHLAPGHYYVRVRRLESGAAGTLYVCQADRSRTFTVH